MRVLLTGSSGMIGTRLFEKLLGTGYDVIGVDSQKNPWNSSLNEKTQIIDLLNKTELENLEDGFDLTIHLAANARVHNLVEEPQLALENALTTLNVMEYVRKHKITKYIFASSREVYGNIEYERAINEDDVRLNECESQYAASKLWGEALTWAYNKLYGINAAIVRFSNVYGMYDLSDRVIPLWIRQAHNNEDLIVYGREKTLDFTYIDDSVKGVLKIIENIQQASGQTFNIASGKGEKLVDVAEKITKLMESSSRIIIRENRTGEIMKFTADITKAQNKLGYHPDTRLDEGLRKAITWYRGFL